MRHIDTANVSRRSFLTGAAAVPVLGLMQVADAADDAPQAAATPVANPLTLVMNIAPGDHYARLKALLDNIQSMPPDKNPIVKALDHLGIVHFARFVFLGEKQLAVITTYDGDFEDYID